MKLLTVFLGLVSFTTAYASLIGDSQIGIKEIIQSGSLSAPTPNVHSLVRISVYSNGCETSRNFHIKVHESAAGQILQILRDAPGPCDRTPHYLGMELETLDLKPASQFPISVSNPVLVHDELRP